MKCQIAGCAVGDDYPHGLPEHTCAICGKLVRCVDCHAAAAHNGRGPFWIPPCLRHDAAGK